MTIWVLTGLTPVLNSPVLELCAVWKVSKHHFYRGTSQATLSLMYNYPTISFNTIWKGLTAATLTFLQTQTNMHIPREADRIMSGYCGVVAIWVTHPPWPERVPRRVIWSPILKFQFAWITRIEVDFSPQIRKPPWVMAALPEKEVHHRSSQQRRQMGVAHVRRVPCS